MSLLVRQDPDLKQPRRGRLKIEFGVTNTAPRTHHLDIAGLGATAIAEAVLMGDGTLPHIGDDFHVGVRMQREAGVRRYGVVVEDAKRSPAHTGGIGMVAEREVML